MPRKRKTAEQKDKPTMKAEDIIAFRKYFKLEHPKELATLLGVTMQAVIHWECNRREVPETTVRLLRLFYKYPQLTMEF